MTVSAPLTFYIFVDFRFVADVASEVFWTVPGAVTMTETLAVGHTALQADRQMGNFHYV